MIEVGYHRVGNTELVRREDELVGPALILLEHLVRAYGGLGSLDYTCAYCAHVVSVLLGSVHCLAGISSNKHLLGVHLVLRKVLDFYIVEVAESAV